MRKPEKTLEEIAKEHDMSQEEIEWMKEMVERYSPVSQTTPIHEN